MDFQPPNPFEEKKRKRGSTQSQKTDERDVKKFLLLSQTGLSDYYIDETPLCKAIRLRDHNAVKTLVEAGVNINLRDINGKAPLHIAVKKNLYIVIDFLIKAGAQLNLRDNNGSTLLHIAIEGSCYYAVEILLKSGAAADLTNNYGKTPLYMAIERGFKKITKLLIDSGANVNMKYSDGETPLHIAALAQCYSIANLLVEAGAKIDMKNNNGDTPLHIAVVGGCESVVELLVQSGARVDLSDNKGDSPLCIAVKKGLKRIVKVLVQLGAVEQEIEIIVKKRIKDVNAASIFTRKFIMYKDICRDKDLKKMIKYGQLYFPEVEIAEYADYDLHVYREELDRMKFECISPNSEISLLRFLLEEDKDILANFSSNVKTRLVSDVKWFYTENYPQYASMILNKLLEGKKRHLLLQKFSILLDHSDWNNLPYPVKTSMTKFLSNADLEKFVITALKGE